MSGKGPYLRISIYEFLLVFNILEVRFPMSTWHPQHHLSALDIFGEPDVSKISSNLKCSLLNQSDYATFDIGYPHICGPLACIACIRNACKKDVIILMENVFSSEL